MRCRQTFDMARTIYETAAKHDVGALILSLVRRLKRHVIFSDDAATTVAPAVEALKVDYEPIIYFVDATGVIVDRLDDDRIEVVQAREARRTQAGRRRAAAGGSASSRAARVERSRNKAQALKGGEATETTEVTETEELTDQVDAVAETSEVEDAVESTEVETTDAADEAEESN